MEFGVLPYKDPAERRVKHAAYRRHRRALGLEPRKKRTPKEREWERQYRLKPEVRARLKQQAREWTAANPEKRYIISRRSRLKKHGITLDQYETMLLAQNGVCAICETGDKSLDGGSLSVDHCHKSGRVRGLLCGNCNVVVGHAKDDIALLTKMIAYLRRHTKRLRTTSI